MENLNKYSPTQLLKLSNDICTEHENMKKDIVNITFEIEELENKLNEKALKLQELEKNYVDIIEKLNG